MIYQRLTVLFVLAAAISIYILVFNSRPEMVAGLIYFNLPAAAVFIAAAAALLILSKAGRLKRMEGGPRRYRVFTPVFCASSLTGMAIALLAMRYASDQYFIILGVFAAFALVFVSYTYTREFFWLSVYTITGIAFLYFNRIFRFPPDSLLSALVQYVSLAAGAVSTVLLAIYVIRAKKGASGERRRLTGGVRLRRDYPFYITIIIIIAGFIAREFYYPAFSYSLTALLISYFVFLLFYTIDLTD